jgi:hypothetical protein
MNAYVSILPYSTGNIVVALGVVLYFFDFY